jgi:hypothetical protein
MIDYPVTIPIHGCTHATATVMTANDDVFDLQRFHRKFKHGKQIEISTMNKVGDVAMDENFPRLQTRYNVGGYTAIGAADPQVFRSLHGRQPPEIIRVFPLSFRSPLPVMIEEI